MDALEVLWPDGTRESFPVGAVDREIVGAGAVAGAAMAIGLVKERGGTMEEALSTLGVAAEFRRRFEAADLIIAKGQGNYEALGGAPDKVFECVGAEGFIARAIRHCRPLGQVLSMGFCTSPDALVPAAALAADLRAFIDPVQAE